MGFFQKIFRRKSSKKNKENGTFLEGVGSDANLVKPKKKKASYNSFRSPDGVKKDNNYDSTKGQKLGHHANMSNDSSYVSSYDSSGGLPKGISSRLKTPVGHLKQTAPFQADFSRLEGDTSPKYATQKYSTSPNNTSPTYRSPQDRRSPSAGQPQSPYYANNGGHSSLQYNQVQQFDRQNMPKPVDSRYIHGQNESKKFQLSRLPNGELVATNQNGGVSSPSSDFDLSTDAEDNEYNRIRHSAIDNRMQPMLEIRKSEEEDDQFSPRGSTMSMQGGYLQSKNSMYLSNDESEFGNSMLTKSNQRNKHYFSDSDNDMFSPTSQNSKGSNYVSPRNTHSLSLSQSGSYLSSDTAAKVSDGFAFSSHGQVQQKVTNIRSDEFNRALSPRTAAIQEAQRMVKPKVNTKSYADSSDSAEDKDDMRSSSYNSKTRVESPKEKAGVIENFVEFQNNNFSRTSEGPASKSVNDATSSVAELLAQAKARRGVSSTGSMTSPLNLPRPSGDSTSARAMVQQRRQEKKNRLESQPENSDDDSKNGENESWLLKEVSGALGPQGIQADLESLGERSYRSRHSHKSNRSGSRKIKGSEASVGSRHSRSSRASRYSIKSTKSHLSHMSAESRSVANDLIRLEMQLAMVGAKTGDNTVKKELEMEAKKKGITGLHAGNMSSAPYGSSSIPEANSSGLTSSQRNTNRTVTTITKRVKKTVEAPAGKLGIILANKTDSKGTVVSGVRTTSVLFDKILPGDRIVAIDGEDVSRMSVSEITVIMSRKSDFERTLTILTSPNQQQDDPLHGAY